MFVLAKVFLNFFKKISPYLIIITAIYLILTNNTGVLFNKPIHNDYDSFMNNVLTAENVIKVVVSHKTVTAHTGSRFRPEIFEMQKPSSNDFLNILKENNIPLVNDYSIFFICGFAIFLLVLLVVSGLLEKHYKKTNKLFSKINEVSNEQLTTAQVRATPINTRQTGTSYNKQVSNSTNKNNSAYMQNNSQKNTPKNPVNNNNNSTKSQSDQMTTLSNKKLASNQIKVRFADVAGVDEAKLEVQEIVDFLKNPNKFKNFGIRTPRGLILFGQPGTGKTLLAKAIAGEADVPFFSLSGSDFAEMYVGVGAARVRNLFDEARKNKPCIIFIDEIDALARKRGASHSSNEEKDQTLNQLLVEMDGFQDNDGIVIIGATNRLDILDPAVLRPGRFDRHVEVPVPDKKGRFAILKIHARNKKLAKSVDLNDVANKTTGFSGAELENLLNEAALLALRKCQDNITSKDIDEAISKVMVGIKKNKNNLSKKEKKIVAYHEAGHAIATKLLAKKVVEKITILPTNKALGYVLKGDEEEQFLYSKEELFNTICIALAGRASEKIYFDENNVTNGASNDFRQATNIAKEMVFSYGMSSLGNISLSASFENVGSAISDNMKDKAFDEVQKILNDAESTVTKFIKANPDKMDKLVKELLEKETLYKDDVNRILG